MNNMEVAAMSMAFEQVLHVTLGVAIGVLATIACALLAALTKPKQGKKEP